MLMSLVAKKKVQFQVFFISLVLPFAASATPLDEYVQKPDSSYSWKVEKQIEDSETKTFIIHLQSQTWQPTEEISSPVWHHWLTLVRPKKLSHRQALLYVGNGRHTDPMPDAADPKWLAISKNTSSVVVSLQNVPNQPLSYAKGDAERMEDNSVAYSWDKAMTTHHAAWNLHFPMVKAVIKAMDAVDEFMTSEEEGAAPLQGYVIAGASKRGWATWLAAAVDPKHRVKAIVPMVIDVLNVQKSMKHHFEAYGFWAPAIKDYIHHGIVQRFQSAEFAELMKSGDAYFYRERLQLPKLIITASGDQFFLPDSGQLYFNDLQGSKYLRALPNTGHSMADSDVFQCLESFYSAIIHSVPIPKFSWKFDGDSVVVRTTDHPIRVSLWSAVNPNARDFRVDPVGKIYTSTPVVDKGDGVYRAKVTPPEKGYMAYFVELEFKNPASTIPFRFTTEVRVTPSTLPFEGTFPMSRWTWKGFEIVGQKKVSRDEIIQEIPLKLGSPYQLNVRDWQTWCDHLKTKFGFAETHCSAVTYENLDAYFEVNIVEKGAENHLPARSFPEKPTVSLSPELLDLEKKVTLRFQEIFEKGTSPVEIAREGYMDYSDPELHRIVQKLIRVAPEKRDLILSVLKKDPNPVLRAKAAHLLNWVRGDVGKTVVEAASLLDDPDTNVRNNISRFTLFFVSQVREGSHQEALVESFVAQLGRPSHSDRNKAIYNLLDLAEKFPELRPLIQKKGESLIQYIAETSVLPNVRNPALKLLEILKQER